VGGYVYWLYSAPGAPNNPTVTRTANGRSITASTGGGSGRITYYNVALLGVTNWSANGTTWGSSTVDAHTTYTVLARAGNEDNATQSAQNVLSYGIPTAVRNFRVVPSTTVEGRISLNWESPTYAGLSVNRYIVVRTDTVTGVSTQIVDSDITSFNDNNLIRGRRYTYTISCIGNGSPGPGIVSSIENIMAPGVPSAPGTPTITSKIGRTVQVNVVRNSDGFGNAINNVTGYKIQISLDNGSTWRSWNNSTTTLGNPGTANDLDTSGNFTYNLLTPAQTYLFRAYAVNSVGNGDTATTFSGLFVNAGGRRFDGTSWNPTINSKRWDGNTWSDLIIAKRWDGTSWQDLT
jgi:hypothetical protein